MSYRMAVRAIVLMLTSSLVFAQENTADQDLFDALTALEPPQTWSAAVHMMIHIGPYTLDMTGDVTTHGKLTKSRMVSGAGGQMVFVKVYTGADGIQWTELSQPPQGKKVVKLDLKQVEEATEGTFGLNLLDKVDGSTALGVNMGEVWREVLETFGEDVTIERISGESGDVFRVNMIFSEATYHLVDASGEMREDDVIPVAMIVDVGADNGLMRYMALLTSEEAVSFEMIFKDLVIDPEVKLEAFEYTPPEDAKVEDVTSKVLAELTGQPVEEEVEDFRLIY